MYYRVYNEFCVGCFFIVVLSFWGFCSIRGEMFYFFCIEIYVGENIKMNIRGFSKRLIFKWS